jgi:hypothetical protein
VIVVAELGELSALTDGVLGRVADLERFVQTLRRDPCSYCNRAGGTIDHIVPRRGKPKADRPLTNLTGACEPCNKDKGARQLLHYLLDSPIGAPA